MRMMISADIGIPSRIPKNMAPADARRKYSKIAPGDYLVYWHDQVIMGSPMIKFRSDIMAEARTWGARLHCTRIDGVLCWIAVKPSEGNIQIAA